MANDYSSFKNKTKKEYKRTTWGRVCRRFIEEGSLTLSYLKVFCITKSEKSLPPIRLPIELAFLVIGTKPIANLHSSRMRLIRIDRRYGNLSLVLDKGQ